MNTESPTIGAPAVPPDVTMDSSGRDRIDIDALHLCITRTSDTGSSQNIHLVENGDLGVILQVGQDGGRNNVQDGVAGTLVISLGVDADHDEVHYSHGDRGADLDVLLGQAIETLVACSRAARRMEGRDFLEAAERAEARA